MNVFIKVLCLFLLVTSFGCQPKEEKTTQLEPIVLEKKLESKEEPHKIEPTFDCDSVLQWLRNNAKSVNPATFSQGYSEYDSSYKKMDTLISACFELNKLKKVKDYFRDGRGKEYYENEGISQGHLLDIYTNKKNQIVAFTIFYRKEIAVNLLYVSINPDTKQAIDAVIIARDGGDMGTLINESSTWLNDSTLIRTTNKSRITLDNVFYQVKVRVNLHKNGKISISSPQTLIDIPFEEVLKREREKFEDE